MSDKFCPTSNVTLHYNFIKTDYVKKRILNHLILSRLQKIESKQANTVLKYQDEQLRGIHFNPSQLDSCINETEILLQSLGLAKEAQKAKEQAHNKNIEWHPKTNYTMPDWESLCNEGWCTCETCQGDGEVECPDCNGTRDFINEVCNECGGSGYYQWDKKCRVCHGTGRFIRVGVQTIVASEKVAYSNDKGKIQASVKKPASNNYWQALIIFSNTYPKQAHDAPARYSIISLRKQPFHSEIFGQRLV